MRLLEYTLNGYCVSLASCDVFEPPLSKTILICLKDIALTKKPWKNVEYVVPLGRGGTGLLHDTVKAEVLSIFSIMFLHFFQIVT